MNNDNKFIMDDQQENFQDVGINQEYNHQDGNDFVYVDNEEGYSQPGFFATLKEKINFKIILIVLLIIFLLLFLFIWLSNPSKKDTSYQDWLDKIKIAAKKYVREDDDIREVIISEDKTRIYVLELIDNDYLQEEDLVNPKTGKSISECNYLALSVNVSEKIYYDDVTTTKDQCPDMKPVVELLGDVEYNINQNDKYIEPGATARNWDGIDLTDLIKVDGMVEEDKVGSYTLTYTVTNEQDVESDPKVRMVNVKAIEKSKPPVVTSPSVDRTRPVIRTTGLPKTIKVGQTAAYTLAYSDNVKLKTITYCSTTCKTETVNAKTRTKNLSFYGAKAGVYTIKASAVDSRGNATSISSKITVNAVVTPDKIIPTITWTNKQPSVVAGTEYTLQIKFTDNVAISRYMACVGQTCSSQSIKPSAIVILPIKTIMRQPGDYIITASAVDTSGNFSGNIYLGTLRVI